MNLDNLIRPEYANMLARRLEVNGVEYPLGLDDPALVDFSGRVSVSNRKGNIEMFTSIQNTRVRYNPNTGFTINDIPVQRLIDKVILSPFEAMQVYLGVEGKKVLSLSEIEPGNYLAYIATGDGLDGDTKLPPVFFSQVGTIVERNSSAVKYKSPATARLKVYANGHVVPTAVLASVLPKRVLTDNIETGAVFIIERDPLKSLVQSIPCKRLEPSFQNSDGAFLSLGSISDPEAIMRETSEYKVEHNPFRN